MRNRIGIAAIVLACAFSLQAQQNMFRIELVPSGSMVALNQPVLQGGVYTFKAWPDGAPTNLRQALVKRVTPLTGPQETIYQIDLVPTGTVTARDNPVLKGNSYVFHTWRDGTLMSLRTTDIKRITALTGDKAFWAEQRINGERNISGNLAMQGTSSVVVIGTPPTPPGSSQAGATNMSDWNGPGSSGISGAPVYGNWQYEGTPGVSDAYAPANATVRSEGDVPRMPAATEGREPPH
jgi:hypothetical protein